MIWTQAQREMLVAMGYQPMLHGRLEAVVEAAPAPGATAAATRGASHAPRAFPQSAAEASAASAQAGVATAALEAALRRAAGGVDVSALVQDLARLRREPALKRALWPSLRALRRRH